MGHRTGDIGWLDRTGGLRHGETDGCAGASALEAGRYGDGGTLFLRVAPGGSKGWVQRLAIGGKRRDLGLGGWPLVTLTEARDQALEAVTGQPARVVDVKIGPLLARLTEVDDDGEYIEGACVAAVKRWWTDASEIQWHAASGAGAPQTAGRIAFCRGRLDAPIGLNLDRLFAADLSGRARAFQSLVGGGMDPARPRGWPGSWSRNSACRPPPSCMICRMGHGHSWRVTAWHGVVAC